LEGDRVRGNQVKGKRFLKKSVKKGKELEWVNANT
jgi:hypothetical protein